MGDVISALSSEQQFIPYRNNKLTMLMQDSLGKRPGKIVFEMVGVLSVRKLQLKDRPSRRKYSVF